jgi:glycosyltransferase involved in cell wall biosynthesis
MAIPTLPAGWHMVVAGRGPMTKDFISASACNPSKLTFRGSLDTIGVVDLYQDADVLVNTPEALSRPDAVFPFKIFEYLASGASVVSSALPRNGVIDTRLIETWDGKAETLADALLHEERRWPNVRHLYNDLAERLTSEFSISAVGKKLQKLF